MLDNENFISNVDLDENIDLFEDEDDSIDFQEFELNNEEGTDSYELEMETEPEEEYFEEPDGTDWYEESEEALEESNWNEEQEETPYENFNSFSDEDSFEESEGVDLENENSGLEEENVPEELQEVYSTLEDLDDSSEDEENWGSTYADMDFSFEPDVVDVEEDLEYNEELGYTGTEETLESEDLETLKTNLITSNFHIEKSAYSLTHDTILIDDIVISGPVTKARSKTFSGLTTSVSDMGILTPIDVLVMEGYQEWLDTPENERTIVYTGNKYLLLQGMRRVFAAKKNGLDEIPAQIWQFNNPEYGREVAMLLSCILDKKQRHSWGEIWNTMGVLENQFTELTPSQLEYLLEIEPGDAMRLKDVMGSEEEYPEIVMDLVDGNKTLQQAYQALQKARKELAQWDREDRMGISGVEEAEGLVEGIGGDGISNSDVMSILNMAHEDYEISEDDFAGDEEALPAVEQDVDDRHPLDPRLRGEVLQRDGYSCQCCHFGQGATASLTLSSLTVHHMLPVYLNKMKHPTVRCQDIPENLVTLCDACHKAVHSCSDSRAKLPVANEEEFFELVESEQERWKNILKYAKIITKGEEATGFKRKKYDSSTLPVSKPFWEAQKENEEAVALAQR